MGAKLSKDEIEYIESNAAASYLLLKHDPSRGIDCFNVYDQGENKEYSINVVGEYRRSGTESPTLVIYDDVGAAVGTMRWNNAPEAYEPGPRDHRSRQALQDHLPRRPALYGHSRQDTER